MSLLKKIILKLNVSRYKNTNFVVVSNNCWGAEVYKSLGLSYNTPFVGLYLYGPDYIKLLESFSEYMKYDLLFTKKSKWINSEVTYPIGILSDVEIHFLHYKDENEATDKWNRRLGRMNKITDLDKYYFKIDDRDLTDESILLKFHELPFKNKISFGIGKINTTNHIKIKKKSNDKIVPDGVKLYKKSFKYIDVLEWVNSGTITNNVFSKIKSFINIT